MSDHSGLQYIDFKNAQLEIIWKLEITVSSQIKTSSCHHGNCFPEFSPVWAAHDHFSLLLKIDYNNTLSSQILHQAFRNFDTQNKD